MMKSSAIPILFAMVGLVSCSTPKYTYYFDHVNNRVAEPDQGKGVPFVNPQLLEASWLQEPVVFPGKVNEQTLVKKEEVPTSKIMTKAFRHQLKRHVRTLVAAKMKPGSVESAKESQAMDHDLKLAATFGAVGLVGLLIGGNGGNVFFVIGGIALLIGVVFFVKWIIRQ